MSLFKLIFRRTIEHFFMEISVGLFSVSLEGMFFFGLPRFRGMDINILLVFSLSRSVLLIVSFSASWNVFEIVLSSFVNLFSVSLERIFFFGLPRFRGLDVDILLVVSISASWNVFEIVLCSFVNLLFSSKFAGMFW